jgi:nucleoid DNA-binding protein
MLSKNEIAADIEQDTGIKPNLVKRVLDSLAELAASEIEEGEDFTVPGIVRLTYTYRAPQKKGARYKKGDTYTGFGGVETTAEEDSKPITEQIRLKASPTGAVYKARPGTKPDAQKAFLRSKAGKVVKARKAK